ncbi:GNAT family N-acetyltransferase [filamentous cyanobacterium CCP5]|nr:GNAT family N-acetyltransferase [filamentous cyanobacterium CCP5]
MTITFSTTRDLTAAQILPIYEANGWSAAQKPEQLHQGLIHSHSLVTAWASDRLVGIGNAISDGHLVVYYPHLLVHPDFQGQGIGRQILNRLQRHYQGFHMQILVSEHQAVGFYQALGFRQAKDTQPMWIYAGNDL